VLQKFSNYTTISNQTLIKHT